MILVKIKFKPFGLVAGISPVKKQQIVASLIRARCRFGRLSVLPLSLSP
jgi:hypothetical protein